MSLLYTSSSNIYADICVTYSIRETGINIKYYVMS